MSNITPDDLKEREMMTLDSGTIVLPTSTNTAPDDVYIPSFGDKSKLNNMSTEEVLNNLDKDVQQTQVVRSQIINKFMPSIMSMELAPNGSIDPEVYEGYTSLINTVRAVLNDYDNVSRNHANIKLKKVDLDQQKDQSIDISNFLAAIKLDDPSFMRKRAPQDYRSAEQKLEERFNAMNSPILDTELEMGGNNLPKREDDET